MNASEYYNSVPEDRKKAILEVRKMILNHEASFKETMDYNLPSYVLKDKVIFSIANMKGHIGFYVCETDLKKKFPYVFKKYNCGKSCIRLKKVNEEIILDLKGIIDKMLT